MIVTTVLLRMVVFFDIERAGNSTGSQTPMTNIDLRSFEPAIDFFRNI
jgi:hypothetical protein